MGIQREIARKLLQINAIKLSPQKPFTWASGLKSPIYCDNRTILSFPDTRKLIIQAFINKAQDFHNFNYIGGVATAGIPHGALLADRLDLPFIYVRSKAKAHGRQNVIEGHLAPGARVLMIEDLISTGGSSIKAVEAVREAGAVVVGVLAIFTYGFQKAVRTFQKADCSFYTLSDYNHLLAVAIEENYVSESDRVMLMEWSSDPENWGRTH